MFRILSNAFFTATRFPKAPTNDDWDQRFLMEKRRREQADPYRFNPHRDLW